MNVLDWIPVDRRYRYKCKRLQFIHKLPTNTSPKCQCAAVHLFAIFAVITAKLPFWTAFYGATIMIKSNLILSAPIVKRFQAK